MDLDNTLHKFELLPEDYASCGVSIAQVYFRVASESLGGKMTSEE